MFGLSGNRRVEVGPRGIEATTPAPVIKYKLSPEELAKYGPPVKGAKPSPLFKLADPATQKPRHRGSKQKEKQEEPEPQYEALAGLNHKFEMAVVNKLIQHWNNGASLEQIAGALEIDPDEVAILVISLGREGKIGPRYVGIYGNRCATLEEG